MEIYQDLGNFLDNYGSPFFVGSLVEKRVLFVNKEARSMFGCTEETCDFEKIFERTEERLESLIEKGLKSGKNSIFYNFMVNTANQEQIVVDFQFGFFNDEKTAMFLEIIPQQDTRLQMALNQIRHSPRAEAILNLDENLSIVDCSESFYDVFECSEELRHSHFKNCLVNGFLPDVRESLLSEIHTTLKISEIFSTDIKVYTTYGEEKWYRFDLQKRELDNSGTKLMCHMVNIAKQVEVKENFDLVNQYLSVIQESTVDLLYRVDIATNTMYSYHEFESIIDNDRAIPDYVNTFFDMNTIHPDDKEIYLKGFQDFYENDIPCDKPIRFSLGGNPYQWYKVTGKKIFDNEGKLKEVFGSLVNVDIEMNMKEEVSTLNKYFDILNDITDESLYFYDLKTEKLRLGGLTEKEIGLPKEVENYPESIYEYVHPDDLLMFQKFDERALDSENNRLELRLKNVDGTYQWYELLSNIIVDDDGNPTEIFGKIKNIQSKHKLKTKVEEANNYLLVMQELSDDILYRIDVEAKTLAYTIKSTSGEIVTNIFKNYPHSVFNRNLMHPDDENIILEQTEEWMSGNMTQYKLRMKLITEDFQWYHDSAINIRDKEGNVTEIYGRLKNIHREILMKEEVAEANQELSILNQYFSAIQSLSGESMYNINLDKREFRIQGEIAQELGLQPVHTDYPACIVERVHPDEMGWYKEFARKTLSGLDSEIKLRGKNTDGSYQWYKLTSKIIRDDTGKAIEILGRIRNIHAEETMVAEVSTLNQYVEAVQSLSGESLFYVDMKTKILRQKGEVAEELGMPEEVLHYPEGAYPFIHANDLENYKTYARDAMNGKASSVQCKVRTVTGVYQWYEIISQPIYNKMGEIVEIFGRMSNINKEMTIKADFSALNQHFSAMQDLSDDILFRIDIKENTFYHSNEETINIGIMLKTENYVETFIANGNIHPDDVEHYRNCNMKLKTGELNQYEMRGEVEKGVYHSFDVKCTLIYAPNGEPVEIFGRMKNIQNEKDLQERAYHDLMTGALNKVTFEEQGAFILENSHLDVKIALIFIDLDDFKGVNDTLGHSYGDALLTTVGKRLKRVIRGDDLVGRIGGDEFAVMLRNVDNEESVLLRTNLMLQSLSRDFSFEKKVVSIKASVGVALYPQHGTTYKDLIGKADIAVYESKRRGKNVVSLYSKELEEGSSSKVNDKHSI